MVEVVWLALDDLADSAALLGLTVLATWLIVVDAVPVISIGWVVLLDLVWLVAAVWTELGGFVLSLVVNEDRPPPVVCCKVVT